MPRGPKRHLKRLAAPTHWMLSKVGGVFAPRPSPGPHGIGQCLPLILILRNRLRYALTRREVFLILGQRLVFIDGKVRTDANFPIGLMDIIKIDRTNETFRLLYDNKGRFCLHKVDASEADYKLCRVKKVGLLPGKIPYLVTHDGRSIRYPHPAIKVNDVIKYDFVKNTISEHIAFATGNICITTGGYNVGRIGIITSTKSYDGAETIVQVQDSKNNVWSTLISNIFMLGQGKTPMISLQKDKGIRLTSIEDRQRRLMMFNAPVNTPQSNVAVPVTN